MTLSVLFAKKNFNWNQDNRIKISHVVVENVVELKVIGNNTQVIGSIPITPTKQLKGISIMSLSNEDKLKALQMLCDVQKAFYKEVDGGPSHVFAPSTLEAIKKLFPQGL